MFGGDEVSALVLDLGSHTCKAGYAGDDTPKAVFPSAYGSMGIAEDQGVEQQSQKKVKLEDAAALGKEGSSSRRLFVGSTALNYRRDSMEVQPCLRDGLLADWDAVAATWEHAIRDRLQVEPSDYAVLLAEPSFNTVANREKTLELMFETLNPPAVFCAKNAVLTSFACGKGTALVVESGHCSTTVSAVHDGYLLHKSIVRSPVAGDLITECLKNALEHKHGIQIRPRYSFRRKELSPGEYQVVDLDFPLTTQSYRTFMQKSIVADLKESLCRVPDSSFDEASFSNVPTVPYELPDGQVVELGGDRFRVADMVFNPELVKTIPGMENTFQGFASPPTGVSKMVLESISRCDADIRRDLFSSVLVSGGTTTMPQMKERLEKEVQEESPPTAKVKVLASGNMVERKFSVWIGGSILASLGSFQQLWLSKAEFAEHGAAYVHRKCP